MRAAIFLFGCCILLTTASELDTSRPVSISWGKHVIDPNLTHTHAHEIVWDKSLDEPTKIERLRMEKDISSSDQYGQTPLWWAAHEGHIRIVIYLVNERKCDLFQRDGANISPATALISGGNSHYENWMVQKLFHRHIIPRLTTTRGSASVLRPMRDDLSIMLHAVCEGDSFLDDRRARAVDSFGPVLIRCLGTQISSDSGWLVPNDFLPKIQ